MNRTVPSFSHRRIEGEFRTIRAMIRIFCRDHHGLDNGRLCRECGQLLSYAEKRLAHCPFQENKPTCGNCTVHCYRKDCREQVRRIMRYAGPKMIFRHPVMALRHLLAGRREAPTLPKAPKPGGTTS